MRTLLFLLLLTTLAPAVCGAAASDDPRGPVGLGIILGEPTGVSLGIGAGDRASFDAAIAWSLEGTDRVHLHGDYLRWNPDAIEIDEAKIPAYYGVGVRVRLNEGSRDDEIGVRFPLGLAWVFADGGLMTFLELAPILDLSPDTDFDINAALGLRFIFGQGRR